MARQRDRGRGAERNAGWHGSVCFGLHFDLHAREKDDALGRDASVEHVAAELDKVRPDWVQCDCKGHTGLASYPTRVGVGAPGIVKVSLRIWRTATASLGIPLVAHYSGVWDTAALRRHPAWGVVHSELQPRTVWPLPDCNEHGRDRNITCRNTGYTAEYMIPQLMEILEGYDVDGFWVDGENWAAAPCYCEKCRASFRKQTGIEGVPLSAGEPGWAEWLAYHRRLFLEHVRAYARAVHSRKPTCTVCSNWMYALGQPEAVSAPVDYLSGDVDWLWSIPRIEVEARFLSNRGLDWDLMSWAFTSYGPMQHWEFKSKTALCQEAAAVLSCGGAYCIYDQPNRSGSLVGWHMDDLAEISSFCRARGPYSRHSESVPQVAVLHLPEHHYANNEPLYLRGEATRPVEGAVAALLEGGYHVDIISDVSPLQRLERYPLCVLAEQDNLPPESADILLTYVERGGSLLASGAEQTRRFDLHLGVVDAGTVNGDEPDVDLHIPVGRDSATVGGTWRLVQEASSGRSKPLVMGRLSRIRDVCPDADGSQSAAMGRRMGKGFLACVFGPVFGFYAVAHYPRLRRFLSRLFDALDTDRGLMRVLAPTFVHAACRRQEDRLLVHLVNTASGTPLAPNRTLIEDVPSAGPVEVYLPLRTAPSLVHLEPDALPLTWSHDARGFRAKIPEVRIHDIMVVEGDFGELRPHGAAS